MSNFTKKEKMKHNILGIVRILLGKRMDLNSIKVEEWDYIVEKMIDEWKDVDTITEALVENGDYEDVRVAAKGMEVSPEDMVVRLKLMYFVAKSEIQILEMKRLLDK
jgi:hypothetical protein